MANQPAWVGFALATAGSVVVSEVGKVEINKYFGGNMAETSLKELMAAGLVAAYKYSQMKPNSEFKQSSGAVAAGGVPWLVILALAAFKVKWSLWRDQALLLAPNPGLAKNVINLNGGLALVIGYLFLSKSINTNMVIGTAMATAGAYVSTL